MDKQPEWVPNWVWREFRERNPAHYPGGEWSSACKKMIAALLADRGCAVVWKAMAKRDRAEFEVHLVLFRILGCAGGLAAEHQIPRAKRKRDGTKIAKLASELRRALLDVRLEPNKWAHPFSQSVMVSAFGSRHTDSDILRESTEYRAILRAFVYDVDAALDDFDDVLLAVKDGGESWASWNSFIPHPANSILKCIT